MSKPGPAVEPYGLAPAFERAVARLITTRPSFYASVGHAVAPERLAQPAVALIVRAAQAHAKDTGRGPSNPFVTLQRATRWVVDGRVTQAEVDAAGDLLEAPGPDPDEAGVIAELVPVLQRVIHGDVAMASIAAYKKGGVEAFDAVEATIRAAKGLGTLDRTTGSRLGMQSLDRIAQLRQGDRLGTGILELDVQLGGGLPRGKTGLFCAQSKGGKSQALISIASFALQQGLSAAVCTLGDLSEEDQEARLIANLTSIPISTIIEGTQRTAVEQQLAGLLPSLGLFCVKYWAAKSVTFQDVAQWVTTVEGEERRKFDLLVVDYIDELGIKDKRIVSEYEVQGQAMRDMRSFVHDRGIWGWTAAQPKRREVKERQKRIEIEDIADSMKKGRIADLILTSIRPTEEEVELFVAGNRFGRDKFSVGPFPHNFACGQFAVPVK